MFAVLFLRLWALQVLSGAKYRAEANDNRVRTIQIDAPRGEIVDANGRALVTNVPGTSLEVWPADLPKSRRVQRAASSSSSPSCSAMPGDGDRSPTIKPYAQDPLTPVVLRPRHPPGSGQLPRGAAARVSRACSSPTATLRSYPYQSLLAQVLGYVGPISEAELPAAPRRRATSRRT